MGVESMNKVKSIPLYDELPYNETLKMHCSWGVFGEEDELGTINLLTPEIVKKASSEVVKGKVFNLSLPLNLPDPPLFRESYKHIIYSSNRNSQDDYLDSFYLQGSSQWDSLRHIRAREFGFYNGITGEEAGPKGNKLGIEKWAEHGMIGRALLVDIPNFMEKNNRPYNPREEYKITPELLEEVMSWQGSVPKEGDILLLRTGYIKAYLQASPEERIDFKENKTCAGLIGTEDMARFLWNYHFAAVCADNPAVEVIPGSPKDGSLHRRLIPMLGFAMGELLDLEKLAEDSAEDRRYTSYFVAVPLNIPGGVGSPVNAVAIK